VNLSEHTVASLLDAIAAKQPAPGGGAVAGLTLALSVALAQMVLNYSLGKKSLQQHAQLHEDSAALLRTARMRALELADEDAQAYEALNAIMRRKDNPPTDADRDRAVSSTIDVPMEVLQIAASVTPMLERLVGATNRYLDSDLAMAAILAEAAAQSACLNIRINLPELSKEAARRRFENHMNEDFQIASAAARRVQDKLRNQTK